MGESKKRASLSAKFGGSLVAATVVVAGCGDTQFSTASEEIERVSSSVEALAAALISAEEEDLGQIDELSKDPERLKEAGRRAEDFGKAKGGTGLIKLYPGGRLTAIAYREPVASTIALRTATFTDTGTVIAAGSPPSNLATDIFIEKEMSNGVDDRIQLGSPNYSSFDVALSRIGTISGATPDHHCTGTLIGSRIVFSAAHCFSFNSSSQMLGVPYFTPQQQGASGSPPGFGTWAPWGTSTVSFAFISPSWISLNCHVNDLNTDCWKYDFVAAVLPASPFNTWMGHPGYTAFGAFTQNDIINAYKKNVGYPGCASNPPQQVPPANCSSNQHQPFGDINTNCGGLTATFGGASASNGWPWSASDNPAVRTGCDVSQGHSGGPIYTFSSPCGSPGPCVFANVFSGWPYPYGAQGVKINLTLFNYLVALRAAYP